MKITIDIDFTLDQLKRGYRAYYGTSGKVTKADIAGMLAEFAKADIEDYVYQS